MTPRILVGVCLSGVLPLPASPAPWGPGCNDRILNSRFALAEAPYFPCGVERQIFIYQVINELKNSYHTMVCEPSPHAHLDSPEFVSCYLRILSAPSGKLHEYDNRFERLLSRLSGAPQAMEDPRLDWDVWRAWLMFENRGSVSDTYESEPGTIAKLESGRELLWQYLARNAAAILAKPQRRTWWIARLTEDMEARGGRPMRRWFLLQLIAASDPSRPGLEAIPMAEKLAWNDPTMEKKVFLRQPHPLDPFLHLGKSSGKIPPFEEALEQMASAVGLGLEIRGVTSRSLPATRIHEVSLEMTKWALDRSFVINQESWSKTGGDVRLAGWEWGVRFSRPMGRRAAFSSVQFPERADRGDGVFFFVFQKRLYVWPKAKMDAAVLQMLDTAGLADSAMTDSFAARGFTPLKTILSK